MGAVTRTAVASIVLLITLAAGQAFAQRDLSGEWSARYHEDQEHRIPGPALGDYTGLPINDAARLKADSWDASILSLREHQAKPHPSTYSLRGPANIRITKEFDPVTQETIAYELFGTFGQATRTIWLDGRPHPPPYAAHTWAGFSTGRWEGDMLTVNTTHFKVGWIQRNGVAHSDQATMTEHFIRHGDLLTVVTFVDDPVYLEEPFVRSSNFVLNPSQEIGRSQFDVVDEIAGHPKGYVPHHLPGSPEAQLKLTEFATRHGLPVEAVRGGAETGNVYMLVGAGDPPSHLPSFAIASFPPTWSASGSGARVVAHEHVLARMSAPTGQEAPTPFAAWPTETFFGADKEIFFNNEAIQVLYQHAAHTDGDVVVFFRRSDVVATGDLFSTTGYPVIDRARGGSIQGVLDGLNRIIDITIPKDKEEGGTYVIPGHGRLCDEADVVEYRDMVTIVRDRIQELIRRGLTLEQVNAARPTLDYDGRYGAPETFIEAVYRGLTR
jgi:glyoxylase-like metal-dependent hydrolase (beta-lactamase superfamily II)